MPRQNCVLSILFLFKHNAHLVRSLASPLDTRIYLIRPKWKNSSLQISWHVQIARRERLNCARWIHHLCMKNGLLKVMTCVESFNAGLA